MLTPSTPNRPGCSLHQDQPSKGFSGGQNSPEGPRYIFTPVLTPGSVHFMSNLNSSYCSLKRLSLLLMLPLLSSQPPTTHSIHPLSQEEITGHNSEFPEQESSPPKDQSTLQHVLSLGPRHGGYRKKKIRHVRPRS